MDIHSELPLFRKDLRLFRGPDELDGSPSYTLYDPSTAEYFKISWIQYKLIQLLKEGMTAAELEEKLKQKTPVEISAQEIIDFFMQVKNAGLLQVHRPTQEIIEEAKSQNQGFIKKILMHYLFFKIPLFNPDSFLDKTYPSVKGLFTKKAFFFYLSIIFLGVIVILNQWDTFLNTFTYFFNFNGFTAYILAILLTKVFHELAHAYTAKKYGLKVPTMGIAFLVLLPVMYTDVTDAWRLKSRKERMIISSAGIITELTIAGFATLFWLVSPEGVWKSIFFVLASINWLNTLVINLNPALRFDGYYLFSDLIGVDNLQPRAFPLTRRAFYRFFLGMELPDSEPGLSEGIQRTLIIYSIYTWIYRIFLYTAIALFVYFKFTKVLGIFLFAVEILLFFIWPIFYEIKVFWKVKHQLKPNMRAKITSSLLLLLLFWLIIPLPHSESFTAITIPKESQPLFTHHAGVIQALHVEKGDEVKKGDTLLVILSKEQGHELAIKEKELEITQKELSIYEKNEEYHSYILEKQKEVDRLTAEIRSLNEAIDQNTLSSVKEGYLYQWDDHLKKGIYVPKDLKIGAIAKNGKIEIVSFIPEADIHYLTVGEEALFTPSNEREKYPVTVERISPVRAKQLLYEQLSSLYQGELPTSTEENHTLSLVESYYPVYFSVKEEKKFKFGQTGKVKVKGPWRSKLFLLFRFLASLFWQEASV